MGFAPKFDLLPEEKREEIYQAALDMGAWETSKRYAQETGMNQNYLFKKLAKYLKKEALVTIEEPKTDSGEGQVEGAEKKLSREEKRFLEGLRSGKIGLEEASKRVSAMVFEKIIKNPGDVKFIDFFRTELLKIKQTEVTDRNNWAMEMINRLFAGKLPPRFCPKCGNDLIPALDEVPKIEGQVVNESLRASENI